MSDKKFIDDSISQYSLIENKQYKQDYNINDENIDYKIEKIFNYKDRLFVLFSRINKTLKSNEVDNSEKNCLFLFSIKKEDRKNCGSNNITEEELNELDLKKIMENKDDNIYLVNLKDGIYKNSLISNSKFFSYSYTEFTENSKADVWARVYRQLTNGGNNNLSSIDFYKIDSENEKGYTTTKVDLNSDDNSKFISLYFNRNIEQGMSYLSYDKNSNIKFNYFTDFGRLGTNDINVAHKKMNSVIEDPDIRQTFKEKYEFLSSINDSLRHLYNYEYMWDYTWGEFRYFELYSFNDRIYSRDSNDNTKKGETNPYKTFPFVVPFYLGGTFFGSEDNYNEIVNGEPNIYKYNDGTIVADYQFPSIIDDNYINYDVGLNETENNFTFNSNRNISTNNFSNFSANNVGYNRQNLFFKDENDKYYLQDVRFINHLFNIFSKKRDYVNLVFYNIKFNEKEMSSSLIENIIPFMNTKISNIIREVKLDDNNLPIFNLLQDNLNGHFGCYILINKEKIENLYLRKNIFLNFNILSDLNNFDEEKFNKFKNYLNNIEQIKNNSFENIYLARTVSVTNPNNTKDILYYYELSEEPISLNLTYEDLKNINWKRIFVIADKYFYGHVVYLKPTKIPVMNIDTKTIKRNSEYDLSSSDWTGLKVKEIQSNLIKNSYIKYLINDEKIWSNFISTNSYNNLYYYFDNKDKKEIKDEDHTWMRNTLFYDVIGDLESSNKLKYSDLLKTTDFTLIKNNNGEINDTIYKYIIGDNNKESYNLLNKDNNYLTQINRENKKDNREFSKDSIDKQLSLYYEDKNLVNESYPFTRKNLQKLTTILDNSDYKDYSIIIIQKMNKYDTTFNTKFNNLGDVTVETDDNYVVLGSVPINYEYDKTKEDNDLFIYLNLANLYKDDKFGNYKFDISYALLNFILIQAAESTDIYFYIKKLDDNDRKIFINKSILNDHYSLQLYPIEKITGSNFNLNMNIIEKLADKNIFYINKLIDIDDEYLKALKNSNTNIWVYFDSLNELSETDRENFKKYFMNNSFIYKGVYNHAVDGSTELNNLEFCLVKYKSTSGQEIQQLIFKYQSNIITSQYISTVPLGVQVDIKDNYNMINTFDLNKLPSSYYTKNYEYSLNIDYNKDDEISTYSNKLFNTFFYNEEDVNPIYILNSGTIMDDKINYKLIYNYIESDKYYSFIIHEKTLTTKELLLIRKNNNILYITKISIKNKENTPNFNFTENSNIKTLDTIKINETTLEINSNGIVFNKGVFLEVNSNKDNIINERNINKQFVYFDDLLILCNNTFNNNFNLYNTNKLFNLNYLNDEEFSCNLYLSNTNAYRKSFLNGCTEVIKNTNNIKKDLFSTDNDYTVSLISLDITGEKLLLSNNQRFSFINKYKESFIKNDLNKNNNLIYNEDLINNLTTEKNYSYYKNNNGIISLIAENNCITEEKVSFITKYFGLDSFKDMYALAVRYKELIQDFDLTKLNDLSTENFFTPESYAYIPLSEISSQKYLFTTNKGDSDIDEGTTNRLISILKNNEIIQLNLDKYIEDPLNYETYMNRFSFFKEDHKSKLSSLYYDNYYGEDKNKLKEIDISAYMTNEEIELENEDTLIDLENLLNDKIPFQRLNVSSSQVEYNGNRYDLSLENKITIDNKIYTLQNDNKTIICDTDENDTKVVNLINNEDSYYFILKNDKLYIGKTIMNDNKSTKLIGVCKFILPNRKFPTLKMSGTDNSVILVSKEFYDKSIFINNLDIISKINDKKFLISFIFNKDILKDLLIQISNNFDNTINDLSNKDLYKFTIMMIYEKNYNEEDYSNEWSNNIINLKRQNTLFTISKDLIEETSIIDDNKSELYDINNQSIITDSLVELTYIKLYDTEEKIRFMNPDRYQNNIDEDLYRFFISINGRILVSDEAFKLTDKKDRVLKLDDFYTINGNVNEIYIEEIDIDNNDLLLVASDRSELYIFDNLFVYNSMNANYKNVYEDYSLKNILKESCIKYQYNFNNEYTIKDDKKYYRETHYPRILNIGSSIDSVSVCDKYINTLNTEFKKEETINKSNSIKYFKLKNDLILDDKIIKREGFDYNDDGTFDDNYSYIKLEKFNKNSLVVQEYKDDEGYILTNDTTIFTLNLRLNINRGEVFKNDRHYELNISLYNEDKEIKGKFDKYVMNHYISKDKSIEKDTDNFSNSIRFEEDNIYKNIYFYLPNNTLSVDPEDENITNEKIYELPFHFKYYIIDSNYPTEYIENELNTVPSRLTFRDFFIAKIYRIGNVVIYRLYFRYRYVNTFEGTEKFKLKVSVDNKNKKEIEINNIFDYKWDYVEIGTIDHLNYIFNYNISYKTKDFENYTIKLLNDKLITKEIIVDYGKDDDTTICEKLLEKDNINNRKLNTEDNTFTISDESFIQNNKDTQEQWITENYMPLETKVYREEVPMNINEKYFNGMRDNIYKNDVGMIDLSQNIKNKLHYGEEKRLVPNIYINGLKLFNSLYKYRDNKNNSESIYTSFDNLVNYLPNTEEHPDLPFIYKKLKTDIVNRIKLDKEVKDIKLNIKDILTNIEVETMYGDISEEEKLLATIDVNCINDIYNDNEVNGFIQLNVRQIINSLNSTGAYFVSSPVNSDSDNDIIIDETNNKNIFKDAITLQFKDDYLANFVNSEEINVYISYSQIDGDNKYNKYARRINPKFVDFTIDPNNNEVLLSIKGMYQYKNISKIYLVTGTIRNHNLFFANIDKELQYIDLGGIVTDQGNQLFEYLSYDEIISAKDLEIIANGYTLYPDVDYTIISNSSVINDKVNFVIFRNNIPDTGNISVEINLNPNNAVDYVYKTHQAYALVKEKRKQSETSSLTLTGRYPISKYITIDNDKYQFIFNKDIPKFGLFINNRKIPSDLIKVVNSKTICLTESPNMEKKIDYPIDMRKTHLAVYNQTTKKYELTNEYYEGNDYRTFDPIYKNILISFQKSRYPYNYEIYLENKYKKENIISLLDNLLNENNSCYNKPNSDYIYNNFDWLCETEGGKTQQINSILKVNTLFNEKSIYNCNNDNLTSNVEIDGEFINCDKLENNIEIDCNKNN